MTLKSEERNAIVMLRLQKAKETLQDAKEIIKLNLWRSAANRLYYACYYAASALLVKHGYSARTHSGVVTLLGIHFVSKGLIDTQYGKFYGKLFELRQTGDYDDWMNIEAEDVQSKIAPAEEFIDLLEKLVLL